MKFSKLVLCSGILAGTAFAAQAEQYSVMRSVDIDAPAAEIWNVIGDFCDLDDWHPAFVGCALKARDGGVHRILSLAGGGEVVEKIVATEPNISYTYAIVEAPLPIQRYTATLAITRGSPATVSWSGRFRSDDASMEALIIDIYESGLDALSARFDE